MTTPSAVDGEERGQEDDDGTQSQEPSFLPRQEPDLNKFKQDPSNMAIPELQGARSSAVESELHVLPSQLRHRHESTRALRQQQYLQKQMPSGDTLDYIESNLDTVDAEDGGSDVKTIPSEVPSEKDDRSSHILAASDVVKSPQEGKATFDDHDGSNEDADLLQMTEPDTAASPPHSANEKGGDSGALIRANSYSIFESISNKSRGVQSDQSHNWSSTASALSQISRSPKGLQLAAGESLVEERWSPDLPEIAMPTRDWVKMQTRINSLEQEVQHVTRTNILLNHELDKLNNHLLRLTSEEGAGWRKEYEFLVQQVDLMHRQLQLAYSQGHGHGQRQGQGQGGDGSAVSSLSRRLSTAEGQQQQPKMTSQLHAEVKDLTASLRSWQSAFQQAEEKYRKKCDGERTLKQTLREREAELSALAVKLSGYEDEFQKSISNYEQLVKLATELEVLEGKKRKGSGTDDGTTTDSSSYGTLRNRLSSIVEKDVQVTATLGDDGSENRSDVVAYQLQGHMPGAFPGGERRLLLAPNVDKLTVSIMSWAALLATYMLS